MFRYGDELTNEIGETDFMEISNIKKREKNESSDMFRLNFGGSHTKIEAIYKGENMITKREKESTSATIA